MHAAITWKILLVYFQEVYPQIIDFNARANNNVLRLRFLGFDTLYFRIQTLTYAT